MYQKIGFVADFLIRLSLNDSASFDLVTAAVLFLTDGTVGAAEVGRVEFAHGKRHIIENPARIILVSDYAFFIGYCVLGRGDEVLRGANDPHYRENTYSNDKLSLAVIAVREMSVKSNRDILGNIVAAATAATRIAFVFFNDLRGKNNGIDDFYHCLGYVLFAAAGLGYSAEAIAGGASEYAYVTFAAVKYYLLFNDRDAFKFLRTSRGEARLEEELDIKSYCERVKSAVELNGIYTDISPRDRRLLRSYCSCTVDNIITAVGQIYTNVLKTVSVPARVEDPTRFNAYALFARLGHRASVTKFTICHISHS